MLECTTSTMFYPVLCSTIRIVPYWCLQRQRHTLEYSTYRYNSNSGIHVPGTGFLTHKEEQTITAECPLFPKSVEKMNALSVISATRANPEAVGPKTDQ